MVGGLNGPEEALEVVDDPVDAAGGRRVGGSVGRVDFECPLPDGARVHRRAVGHGARARDQARSARFVLAAVVGHDVLVEQVLGAVDRRAQIDGGWRAVGPDTGGAVEDDAIRTIPLSRPDQPLTGCPPPVPVGASSGPSDAKIGPASLLGSRL